MGQLHEVLAIEGDLKGKKNTVKDKTLAIFNNKPNLFLGFIKVLKMFDANKENEEAAGGERLEITTTVPKELDHISEVFTRFWDAKLQKEAANQQATADIIIDGTSFLMGAPVTFLLGMEEELKQLHKLYSNLPTLQPGIDWVKDSQKGKGYWKAVHPIIKQKTKQLIQSKIVAEPTKEHPAQVREWSEDVPVGKYCTESWSGMISPAEKARILDRLDTVLRVFKKARQRANNQEVINANIGRKIFDFIHKDLTA